MSVDVIKKPGRLPALEHRNGADSNPQNRLKLFARKSGQGGGDIEMMGKDISGKSPASPGKPMTAPNTAGLPKSKKGAFVNRKNVSHGRVTIQIKPDDRVADDANLDFRENHLEALDANPQKLMSFMENLKTGSFYQIYNTVNVNLKPEKIVSKGTSMEHLDAELTLLVFEYNEFLRKCIIFFQGLLAGLSILHLYLINLESDDQQNIYSYARYAIRLNQVFQVVTVVSCAGTLVELLKYYKLYNESRRKQSDDLMERRKVYNITLIAFILYFICYGIVIFTHEFSALISNQIDTVKTALPDSISNRIIIWKLLNWLQAIAAVFGWLLVVKNSYANEKEAEDLVDDDATQPGDDTFAE